MGQTVNLLAYAFGGSNPSLPTKNCGSSSVDRALAFQAEGRGFESRLPLMKKACLSTGFFFVYFSCCNSSVVEHFLGKEEVPGSNPGNSS